MSGTKLFYLTLAVIATTIFTFGIVVIEDPPGVFGYFFGAFVGGAWVCLLWIFCDWLEQRKVPRHE